MILLRSLIFKLPNADTILMRLISYGDLTAATSLEAYRVHTGGLATDVVNTHRLVVDI